jgi:hypothetical protein
VRRCNQVSTKALGGSCIYIAVTNLLTDFELAGSVQYRLLLSRHFQSFY